MKTFRILGLVILFILLVIFIGAFFLPKEVKTHQTRMIEAPLDTVYNLVNDFNQWKRWSPWYDTTKLYTITGEAYGEGAIMRWVDAKGQVGEREIQSSMYPERIVILTQFREEDSKALMDFSFKAYGQDSVEVSIDFGMDYHFGYPFGRYVAWMLQAGVDNSFPRALANLEDAAEPDPED